MAELTVYARSATPVYVAAEAGGDTFRNDGDTELVLYNTGPSAITVTVSATRRCNQGFLDDDQFTVNPSERYPAGPFAASRFSSAAGLVSVTYSSVVGLQVAAKRLR